MVNRNPSRQPTVDEAMVSTSREGVVEVLLVLRVLVFGHQAGDHLKHLVGAALGTYEYVWTQAGVDMRAHKDAHVGVDLMGMGVESENIQG